jgi:hypothetical protein
MQHRAILRYTEPLVAQAVRLYWRRTIGLGLFVAVALLAALLVWRVADGDRSWLVGLLAAVVLLGVLVPMAVFVVHYRNSMGKFREMAEPVAEFLADEDVFTLSSDRGTTTLKWGSVTEVWRFHSLWLLLFSKAQFVTIPLEGMPEQMRSFVLDRVNASGGKIAV